MTEQDGTEDMHDLAPAYAVDALDPAERARFETHLTSCPGCAALVQELQEAAVELSAGLEAEPPAALRARVLEAVRIEAAHVDGGHVDDVVVPLRPAHRAQGPSRRRGGRWLTAAAAAAAVVVAGVWGVSELRPDDPAQQVVSASDAREYSATTSVGTVTVISSSTRDAAVLRLPDDVEPPPAGSVYQAWFVGTDGSARSAGLLPAEVLESGEVVLEGTPAGAAAVGLSVEPDGGSPQPTTEPFAVVPLS
ncbi:anti-sigma factor [Ornithinimicrobium cerasi]|uniref:anti-sigma factor n=1 Tax=Ornithinimicrobium cerasi TaxID=2248773 RepID=UPI000F009ABF|nr:anti-sigma factor [Ornithinimicrobium cerasi]